MMLLYLMKFEPMYIIYKKYVLHRNVTYGLQRHFSTLKENEKKRQTWHI